LRVALQKKAVSLPNFCCFEKQISLQDLKLDKFEFDLTDSAAQEQFHHMMKAITDQLLVCIFSVAGS
jgi:hypothetical protein